MTESSEYVVMIPARGNSERVKNKNIKRFRGRPLIEWQIENAQSAGYVPFVVTDSDRIAHVAINAQARVVVEPAELATETTPLADVVRFFVDFMETDAHVIYLQATSPLMDYRTITKAVNLHSSGEYDSVYSAWRASFIIRDSYGVPLNYAGSPRYKNYLPWSKDFKDQWVQDSALYILSSNWIRKMRHVIGGTVGVVETEFLRWLDIDTVDDFVRGEKLAKLLDK